MVIKGSARAAPGELAYHLLREDTNERVSVLELSGIASLDLREALAELDGMGAGSRSRRTLYHASINTPVSEQLDPGQQRIARERLAERMGLGDQPYAVVQHVKHGRQHTHVVWSRIDTETGRAIHDGFNYRKHEEVARELEREFGHQHVLGAHVRDKAHEPRPERAATWAEMRQAERSGLTPAQAKTIISEIWRQTETGFDFRQRLEAQGFTLARGEHRDFLLIDRAGEIHGLTRRIADAKAKDVRERMADVDTGQLPEVAQAREQLRLRRETQDREDTIAFTGAADRLRAEELKREAEARGAARPALGNADREAADALRQLGRTMRAEVGAVVIGKPGYEQRQEVRAELKAKPETNAQPVSHESRNVPEPAFSGGTDPAATSLEATLRPSVEPEIPAPAPKMTSEPANRRPSAVLFVRIFGWLVDRYQRVFERAVARSPGEQKQRNGAAIPVAAPEPGPVNTPAPARRETFLDRYRDRHADRAQDEEARMDRERTAQALRNELRRKPDGSRKREWEPDS